MSDLKALFAGELVLDGWNGESTNRGEMTEGRHPVLYQELSQSLARLLCTMWLSLWFLSMA